MKRLLALGLMSLLTFSHCIEINEDDNEFLDLETAFTPQACPGAMSSVRRQRAKARIPHEIQIR